MPSEFQSQSGPSCPLRTSETAHCAATADTTPHPRRSHTTYYTLTPSSASPVIAFSSVLSHQSTPLPASLPQTAEAVSLLWKGDLLAPVAYLSADERAKISEYKVRVKTPSPRILSVKGPDGFETVHSKGQAGATFLAKSVAELGPQVRLFALSD